MPWETWKIQQQRVHTHNAQMSQRQKPYSACNRNEIHGFLSQPRWKVWKVIKFGKPIIQTYLFRISTPFLPTETHLSAHGIWCGMYVCHLFVCSFFFRVYPIPCLLFRLLYFVPSAFLPIRAERKKLLEVYDFTISALALLAFNGCVCYSSTRLFTQTNYIQPHSHSHILVWQIRTISMRDGWKFPPDSKCNQLERMSNNIHIIPHHTFSGLIPFPFCFYSNQCSFHPSSSFHFYFILLLFEICVKLFYSTHIKKCCVCARVHRYHHFIAWNLLKKSANIHLNQMNHLCVASK